MKRLSLLPTIIAALALGLPAFAADHKHDPGDHSHERKVAGPNGGRILTGVTPRAEFLVTADRKVQITFLGLDGKAVAPAEQVVTVTAGDRSAPTRLTFTKSGLTLVSSAALPAGNNFPTVVQIKATPAAKAVTARFNLDLGKCGECTLSEYACLCGH